jgi:hypothetical protein
VAKTPLQTINQLCDLVRQTAEEIHLYHCHGHLEKVYENKKYLLNDQRSPGVPQKDLTSLLFFRG